MPHMVVNLTIIEMQVNTLIMSKNVSSNISTINLFMPITNAILMTLRYLPDITRRDMIMSVVNLTLITRIMLFKDTIKTMTSTTITILTSLILSRSTTILAWAILIDMNNSTREVTMSHIIMLMI